MREVSHITKKKIRNRLHNENIDKLVRIMVEGEKIENFGFCAALRIWNNENNRTIQLKNDKYLIISLFN